MTKPLLLAVGAAHLDRRGTLSGPFVPAASNPGTMREEVGGVAFNAARAARRQGVAVALCSLRGGDAAGEAVARAVEAADIADLSATFLDRATASYTALIASGGEMIAGFADMGLYEAAFARQMRRRALRDAAAHADAILCEANMPAPAIEALCRVAGSVPVHAIAISPAKAPRLLSSLSRLECVFMNRVEARVLAGLSAEAPPRACVDALLEAGLRRGVVTAGAAPLLAFDGEAVFELSAPPLEAVVDETGAGDALAGATIARLMLGDGFAGALRHGIAAARLTAMSASVVADPHDAAFAAELALVGAARSVA